MTFDEGCVVMNCAFVGMLMNIGWRLGDDGFESAGEGTSDAKVDIPGSSSFSLEDACWRKSLSETSAGVVDRAVVTCNAVA